MKILKAKEDTVYLYDLVQFLLNKNVNKGQRFGVSWKVGKKRKLRAYTLINWEYYPCDVCGDISDITLKKGEKTYRMNNHFGLPFFHLSSF